MAGLSRFVAVRLQLDRMTAGNPEAAPRHIHFAYLKASNYPCKLPNRDFKTGKLVAAYRKTAALPVFENSIDHSRQFFGASVIQVIGVSEIFRFKSGIVEVVNVLRTGCRSRDFLAN